MVSFSLPLLFVLCLPLVPSYGFPLSLLYGTIIASIMCVCYIRYCSVCVLHSLHIILCICTVCMNVYTVCNV